MEEILYAFAGSQFVIEGAELVASFQKFDLAKIGKSQVFSLVIVIYNLNIFRNVDHELKIKMGRKRDDELLLKFCPFVQTSSWHLALKPMPATDNFHMYRFRIFYKSSRHGQSITHCRALGAD